MVDERLTVVYPEGRGIEEWRVRHRANLVPDQWPYGLNHLAEHWNGEVRAREADRLSVAAIAQVMLLRQRRMAPSGVALAWEENLALRLVSQQRARVMGSGVIWATDRVARGEHNARDWVIRRVLRQMDFLWVLSAPQADVVSAWLGPGAPPVHYLPFGVDTEFYRFADYPARQLVFSAGGDRDRDAETLFGALHAIRLARPNVECVVQTKSQLRPPPGVRVIPYLSHDEMRQWHARASVVLIPTKRNMHASGMTVGLEAMSVGRPVIVSDTPGMSEYFGDTLWNPRCSVGDRAGMADRALRILGDPQLGERIGRDNRRHVVEQHSTQAMAKALAGLAFVFAK